MLVTYPLPILPRLISFLARQELHIIIFDNSGNQTMTQNWWLWNTFERKLICICTNTNVHITFLTNFIAAVVILIWLEWIFSFQWSSLFDWTGYFIFIAVVIFDWTGYFLFSGHLHLTWQAIFIAVVILIWLVWRLRGESTGWV